MIENHLHKEVRQLANVMSALPDESLGQDWTWRDHDEGLRFALIGTYHELRDLAATLSMGRQAEGIPVTSAQHVLGQYHAAFRDLEALLLNVGDGDLERPPAKDEWPLRRILSHMIGSERVFFTLVYFGVDQHRAGLQPEEPSDDDLAFLFGHEKEDIEDVVGSGSLESILSYQETLHERVLRELSVLTEEELWAPSRFWEPEPLPVRYRLHRFDAHLRQHTVQVDKTLAALGHVPNEASRLLRLVYSALAEVEGFLIGAWDIGYAMRAELAAQIGKRSEEVAAAVDSAPK